MQAEMESPIASGADPFVFFAAMSSAAEPKITMTRTNVMKNSMPNPWIKKYPYKICLKVILKV